MAASVHERLLQVVTGNPGTGAVTLGAAVAGFQALVAGDTTNAFDVVIYSVDTNGNPTGLWEVQAQAVYTTATTSLARTAGNVIDGSSGPGVLVNFASGTQRVANVLSTAGVWIVRATAGTAGTDQGNISHDGTNGLLINDKKFGTVIITQASGASPTSQSLQLAANSTANFAAINGSNAGLLLGNSATNAVGIAGSTSQVIARSDWAIGFSASGTVTSSADTVVSRAAAGVFRTTDASGTTPSWLQITPGEASLAAPFTNATLTPANTNLSLTVKAGRSYRIEGILQVSNSTAGEGAQFAWNGGGCTATTFFVSFVAQGTNTPGTVNSTTLAGVINYTSITGTNYIAINGFIKVNAGGTLILTAAENTHSTGTLTIGAGSWIALADTVPL